MNAKFTNCSYKKTTKVLFIGIILLLLFSCTGKKGNILEEAENHKPYVKKNEKYNLVLIDTISYYFKNKEKLDISPVAAVVNQKKNIISILDRYQRAIVSFDADNFSNGVNCISFIQKNKGKGPDEFNMPNDIVYDEKRDLYYISDLQNFCVYVENSDFKEVQRIKLPFRPFRISISKNYLFVTPYFSLPQEDYIISGFNLNTLKFDKGLFKPIDKGTNLEKSVRNNILIAPVYSANKDYFVVKGYPNFNIYHIVDGKIVKTFTSPAFKKKILPKPKFIYRNNDKKIWGLNAFCDLIFDEKTELLFALTTNGWKELAEKEKIGRYILVFDKNGNTLCQYQITPYEGGENSLCFDSQNMILYYLGGSSIRKFKLKNI